MSETKLSSGGDPEASGNRVERPEETYEDKAARIAHQLKTPLSIVEGYSRIASQRVSKVLEKLSKTELGSDGKDISEELEQADSHLGRLLAALEQLKSAVEDLSSGYIDADLVRPWEMQITDLRALIREVLHTIALLPERGGSTFEIVGPNLLIQCDAARLKQAICSIILRCSRHGKADRFIIRIERAGREAMISFEDHAEPLSEEQMTVVFSNSAQSFSKSSIAVSPVVGLTIAQSIVVAHGGVLTITPRVESGNQIRIRLPALPIEGHTN